MNKNEIENLIPHREPMLLLDEILLDEDGSAHGFYHVRGDEWFLKGHFPGNPVVPGVIQCEMMAQTCCVLLGDSIRGCTPYFTGLDKVRIRNPVLPGDTLELICYLTKVKAPFYFSSGKGYVDGKLCVSGDFSFALVKPEGV